MFKKKDNTNSALFSVVLVIAETLISILLRFDKPLKTKLLPLIKKDIVICVRTYLPHYCFYVSFTENGLLLDQSLPEDVAQEDILISGSTLSIVKILLTGDESLVKKLQFRGDDNHIELLKDCVQSIGVQNVVSDVFTNIKNLSPEEQQSKIQQINAYKKHVTSQESHISELNQSLQASQSMVHYQNKHIKILYGILVLLGIAVVALLVYLFV